MELKKKKTFENKVIRNILLVFFVGFLTFFSYNYYHNIVVKKEKERLLMLHQQKVLKAISSGKDILSNGLGLNSNVVNYGQNLEVKLFKKEDFNLLEKSLIELDKNTKSLNIESTVVDLCYGEDPNCPSDAFYFLNIKFF